MSADQQKLQAAIENLENLVEQGILSPEQAEISLAPLRAQLATYTASAHDGAIAQGDGTLAVGSNGLGVQGDLSSAHVAGAGNQVIQNSSVMIYNIALETLQKKALPHPEALKRYLENVIASHQWLRLQGIRAGDQPLSVALEKVYVSLTALDKHGARGDSGALTLSQALKRYRRLVVIGDPGSGKTTLLAYLALTYARTLADARENEQPLTRQRLNLPDEEARYLPIILPLRDLARDLTQHAQRGAALLFDVLQRIYAENAIALPENFFLDYCENGQAVLLLDGMDEVAEDALRQQVARWIEQVATRFSKVRIIVTSRKAAYADAVRIQAQFGLAEIREFSTEDVRQFVRDWTRVVEASLAGGESDDTQRRAAHESENLIRAIETNARVSELAVNPLLLTVIALMHRYRAQLPERRSELYEEAVEVLLWHWDKAKGLAEEYALAGLKLDSGDRRSLLEPIAFWMHEQRQREIELHDLKRLLLPRFIAMTGDSTRAEKALNAFVQVIQQRSGLLIARGLATYGFAHLTFQEYLTARALAGREDAIAYTLERLGDVWWREVILLQAGYLSTQGPSRVSRLVQAIMNQPAPSAQPHHNLLLAAECLFDVGTARVEGDLLGSVRQRLKTEADVPLPQNDKPALLRKISAMNALARVERGQFGSQFWKLPHGEPEWVTIPAGEFWMGSDNGDDDEKPRHKMYLPEYQIARVPITNAQYALFIAATGYRPPQHFRGKQPPQGAEDHPVVNVSFSDALAYCRWLSSVTGKQISLPSEAEWEKAARGPLTSNPSPTGRGEGVRVGQGMREGVRVYPWGDEFDSLRCNSKELGLDGTTPVGLFLTGASPYDVLEMSGNVWEWTCTIWAEKFKYPYNGSDGRERVEDEKLARVVRGGSFSSDSRLVRCAVRGGYLFYLRNDGFRVVVSPCR